MGPSSRAGLEGTIDMFYESIIDEVSREHVPTLVLAGEADPLFPPNYARQFVAGVNPAAGFSDFPAGMRSHWLFTDPAGAGGALHSGTFWGR